MSNDTSGSVVKSSGISQSTRSAIPYARRKEYGPSMWRTHPLLVDERVPTSTTPAYTTLSQMDEMIYTLMCRYGRDAVHSVRFLLASDIMNRFHQECTQMMRYARTTGQVNLPAGVSALYHGIPVVASDDVVNGMMLVATLPSPEASSAYTPPLTDDEPIISECADGNGNGDKVHLPDPDDIIPLDPRLSVREP